jgi:tetratricopeptide (TPR) repeat protein
MLRALRDHTAPGESAVVLAWRDITDAVPAYRATLRPVLYRENPRSRQRADADRFFDSVMATTVHLEILTRYQVNYLILSGDREITSQYDLLPEYFQLLYRNEYGTLYRVAASLEPNAVVEANTTTNYGEWAGAIQAYNAILAAEPDNSLAYTGLGIILHLLDKPKAAVRELEAAVRAAPANAQAHYRLVLLYRQMGLEVQAAEHIQSAGRLMENIQRAP